MKKYRNRRRPRVDTGAGTLVPFFNHQAGFTERMEQSPGTRIIFDLFESSGIGLVGLDTDNAIVAVNLNTLFVQLLETAEQIAMPNRVSRSPVDLSSLIEVLAAKIHGLASEHSAGLSWILPPHLPSTPGDYHWLYLGLFGVLTHALRSAPALTEVAIAANAGSGQVSTVVTVRVGEESDATPWPPTALFPLDEAHPRIGRLAIDELAVIRAIFLLHAGELRVARLAERTEYTVTLPA